MFSDRFSERAIDWCEKCNKEKPLDICKLCRECFEERRETNRVRVDLYVPYEDREFVKSLGARWDNEKKIWYANHYLVYVNENTSNMLCKYKFPNTKEYFKIPYSLKDEAKALGAKWDGEVKKWYVWSQTTNQDFYDKFIKFKEEKTEWEKMMYED